MGGGIREPYYIKAPGVTKPGGVSAVPVNGIDWYPTLLDLAGVNVPAKQAVDGVSIVPLLKGGKIAKRPLYWHYPHYGNQGGEPSSIISQNDWKLIHYHEDGRDELYHLANDPNETTDLAKRETKRAKQLRKNSTHGPRKPRRDSRPRTHRPTWPSVRRGSRPSPQMARRGSRSNTPTS